MQHTVQLTTAAMLPSVAVRKYTAGTSGMGSRGLSSDNVSVTPCRLNSATCRRQDKGWLPLCLCGRWAVVHRWRAVERPAEQALMQGSTVAEWTA